MRKNIKNTAAILAGCAILFSCVSHPFTVDAVEAVPVNCEYSNNNFVVSGDDGYYLLCNNLIAWWDGDISHEAVPLCDRPNCSHNSADCPAVVPGAGGKLFYDDGSLYLFGMGSQDPVTKKTATPLIKIAADGSSRETALSTSDSPELYTIYQGKVYYTFCIEDEDEKQIEHLFCQPLSGGEETLLWESELQYGSISTLQWIGGKLYLGESGIDRSVDMDDPELDFDSIPVEDNLFVYDPEIDEWAKNTLKKDGIVPAIFNVYNGRIYYSYSYSLTERELWSMPAEGNGEPVRLCEPQPNVGPMDKDYIYRGSKRDEEARTLSRLIYDYEGNVVQEIPMSYLDGLTLVPGTEDYVFGSYTSIVEDAAGEGGYPAYYAVVVLERDKIADGTAEMIPLIKQYTYQYLHQ